uniref:NLR family CARD domain-containing protein 4 n=1 Tax=Xenopus tropicalis TaxID=8364 RepID=A0A6I8SQN2_XENTR
VDLIRKNYAELVQRMGRTIAVQITNDLFTRNILSMGEMEEILSCKVAQDLTRELLNVILKKGTESCTRLLQSLENQDPFFYEDLIGQRVQSGVTEEDLENLADHLKRLYQYPFFKKFNPLGEDTDIDIIFDLDRTFTDPLLWRKGTLNRREKQLTLSEMLEQLESPCVIEGEAGKGKTTILKRIAMLWASEKCRALADFKLVFFVTLRGASEGLYETLSDQLFPITYSWNKKEFLNKIWHLGRKVLFLLDGYDEFQSESCTEIEELIKNNPKFNSTVIVSTRTETIGKLRRCGALIAETSDFSLDNAKQLIANVLEEDEANGLLFQLEESSFMQNLMKTPLFVVIACALRMGESDFQMNTQTTLFSTLYDLMVEKKKYKIRHLSANILAANIRKFGDLALDGLFEQRFDFNEKHLSKIKEEVLLNIGLLNKYTAQRRKAVYRYFHTTFQEYIAGRRLSQLLSSEDNSDVTKGEDFLNKIVSVFDITTKYKNLLLYTCGSSKVATQKVVKHVAEVHKHDKNNYSTELVEFGLNLFFESSTKKELSQDFETLFSEKCLYINSHNISSHHIEFFLYLPNCLSALQLIKLDLSGTFATVPSESTMDRDSKSAQSSVCDNYIPEKAVKLFFDWNQSIQTLEVTLRDFHQLNKKDIKYLGKICCSADSLRLNIKRSSGITGSLVGVLESCKNIQDLNVDSTKLSIEDERRIVQMTEMKTLSILNLHSEHLQGGLLEGLCNLVGLEKLVFHNIKIDKNDAKTLAEGILSLKKLKRLSISHISNIGDGMESIAESISLCCHELKELKLIDCCLSAKALRSLGQSLYSLSHIEILDLSGNYLLEEGKESVEELAANLTHLDAIRTLMLPGGTDVKFCLEAVLPTLRRIPTLSELAFKRWNLTNDDLMTLASYINSGFENLSFLDLSDNCAQSAGWLSLTAILQYLPNLTYVNFSTEDLFTPDPDLVRKLVRAISALPLLHTMELNNWQLDDFDLAQIKKAKNMIHRPGNTCGHFFQVSNMEFDGR